MGDMMSWNLHLPMMSGYLFILASILIGAAFWILSFKESQNAVQAFDQNSLIIIVLISLASLVAVGMHIFWAAILAFVVFGLYYTFLRPKP